MNIMVIMCLLIGFILLMSSVIFYLLKEKSVSFIAGFNSLTEEEQEKYER